jgi:hypothetical protein
MRKVLMVALSGVLALAVHGTTLRAQEAGKDKAPAAPVIKKIPPPPAPVKPEAKKEVKPAPAPAAKAPPKPEEKKDVKPAPAPAASKAPDNLWRFSYYNNRWWYYQPDKTWVHWDGKAWQPSK